MTTLVQLALAFASIIVIGTLAAWLHDALEARRPVARVRDRYRSTAGARVASRSAARPRAARPGPLSTPRQVAPTRGTSGGTSRGPSRSPAPWPSRSPAPHGAMRVVARRLGSHVIDT